MLDLKIDLGKIPKSNNDYFLSLYYNYRKRNNPQEQND